MLLVQVRVDVRLSQNRIFLDSCYFYHSVNPDLSCCCYINGNFKSNKLRVLCILCILKPRRSFNANKLQKFWCHTLNRFFLLEILFNNSFNDIPRKTPFYSPRYTFREVKGDASVIDLKATQACHRTMYQILFNRQSDSFFKLFVCRHQLNEYSIVNWSDILKPSSKSWWGY